MVVDECWWSIEQLACPRVYEAMVKDRSYCYCINVYCIANVVVTQWSLIIDAVKVTG